MFAAGVNVFVFSTLGGAHFGVLKIVCIFEGKGHLLTKSDQTQYCLHMLVYLFVSFRFSYLFLLSASLLSKISKDKQTS